MTTRCEDKGLRDAGVIAGNYFNKYESRNPITKLLMSGFYNAVEALVARTGARDVHEVGCGEGYLTARLTAEGRRLRGSDVSPAVIAQASQNAREAGFVAEFKACSIYDLEQPGDAAELVVCCEVLEHLEHPGDAVELLADLARPYLIASVPREPLWRAMNMARGRYWSDLGNTPGHLQHWSGRAFLRLLEPHFEVQDARHPIPWVVVLCRSRSSPPSREGLG